MCVHNTIECITTTEYIAGSAGHANISATEHTFPNSSHERTDLYRHANTHRYCYAGTNAFTNGYARTNRYQHTGQSQISCCYFTAQRPNSTKRTHQHRARHSESGL